MVFVKFTSKYAIEISFQISCKKDAIIARSQQRLHNKIVVLYFMTKLIRFFRAKIERFEDALIQMGMKMRY